MAAHAGRLAYVKNRYPDFGHEFKEQTTQNCSVQKQRKIAHFLTSLHFHFLSISKPQCLSHCFNCYTGLVLAYV